MAIKHVAQYYYNILNQHIEFKDSLKDFDDAFSAGYITEERLNEIKEEFIKEEDNLARIQYIMYLLSIPNKKNKQNKYYSGTKDVIAYFEDNSADLNSIINENINIINTIKKQLKEITTKELK